MKIDDKLNTIFDLEPVQYKKQEVKTLVDTGDKKQDDFDLARTTLRDLISTNQDVLTDLVNIAKSSEHPRAFEVAGQLIKAQSDIAKDLLGIHKQKKEIDGEEVQNIQTQNNIVFAGSTSDLMKMISTQKAKTIDNEE